MKSRVLVVSDQEGLDLKAGVANAVAAGALLGEVTLLLIGRVCQQAIQQASELAGVSELLLTGFSDSREIPGSESLAAGIVNLMEGYSHLLMPASSFGRDILPRVAGLMDQPPVTEVVGIRDDHTFIRPLHAGNALATVQLSELPALLTIRTTAFAPASTSPTPAPIRKITLNIPQESHGLSRRLGFTPSPGERPDLNTARIVVAGGQGVAEAGSFELIEAVADGLGGAVGATRAAVDGGLAPNDWQIGQTGRIIGPDIYIGAGISGAIQHLAGIKDARCIVAINSDPTAPLHSVADVSLTMDLFEALPALMEALDRPLD
ncbi:MAG: electron transfer flavoprotein subunit alpha/FixB family protein [Magnetococcales bacterium]|nr:electron transfer flavoprotein subunit alpha/FixB family protein [Magnetococcales bacterium]